MATLAQATETTRVLLKWGAILIVAFIVLRFILFPLGKVAYNMAFPKKPNLPTVTFGKLPKIQFPLSAIKNNFTYKIQTTTGNLPATPDRMNVYSVIESQAGFSLLDSAKNKVSTIGFKNEGVPVSSTVYDWKDPDANRTIRFDIATNRFDLTSQIATDSANVEQSPTKQEAISAAKNFLSSMSLLPQDLDDQKTKATFLKIVNEQLVPATSLSESDFVQVDFYRKDINNFAIETPYASRSLISFLIQNSQDGQRPQIIEAHYSYKPINTKTTATYPIKTAQVAFNELAAGGGYIVKTDGTTGGTIKNGAFTG